MLLTENKKGASQNGQTPSIIGICSYCVLDQGVQFMRTRDGGRKLIGVAEMVPLDPFH